MREKKPKLDLVPHDKHTFKIPDTGVRKACCICSGLISLSMRTFSSVFDAQKLGMKRQIKTNPYFISVRAQFCRIQFMWEQNWRNHELDVLVATKDYLISAKFSSITEALIPDKYYCFPQNCWDTIYHEFSGSYLHAQGRVSPFANLSYSFFSRTVHKSMEFIFLST